MQTTSFQRAIPNDEWLTDGDVPDPDTLPYIPGWQILVRPISIREKTKGGIILPDKAKDDIAYLTTVGRVLKVGDRAFKGNDAKYGPNPWCKEGDYVVYGRNVGTKFFYKGVRILLLADDNIMMIVEDPKNLDPSFHLSN